MDFIKQGRKSLVTIMLILLVCIAGLLVWSHTEKGDVSMGVFDKIKLMFSGKSSDAAASDSQDMIHTYDKYGREVLISKKDWKTTIIPRSIKENYDNPDGLYDVIYMALNDGFFKEILPATKRLLEIDPDKERSSVVRAITLMKTGSLDSAEDVLNQYIQNNGPSGNVLTNLSKVHYAQGHEDKSLEILWESLQLDPNQDIALQTWAITQKEKEGDGAYIEAIRDISRIKGSWRAQLYLANDCLERNELDEAKEYYTKVLEIATDQSDALMNISGALGKHGYIQEVIDMVAPVYDAQAHDYLVGRNLLQAYYEAKNYQEGMRLLPKLYALNRPDIARHLDEMSQLFEQIKEEQSQSEVQIDPENLSIQALRIERPIWVYGMKNPTWLFDDNHRTRRITFIPFSNISLLDKGGQSRAVKEDEIGRLTRSIPLYLAESCYFWSDWQSHVVVPTIKGAGAVVYGMEWQPEQLEKMVGKDDSANGYVVTGTISKDEDKVNIELKVRYGLQFEVKKVLKYSCTEKSLGKTILKMESEILGFTETTSVLPHSNLRDIYVRPDVKIIPEYLKALGQSLAMSTADAGVITKDQLWGERNMIYSYLDLIIKMDSAQQGKLMFLSGLAKSKSYGSEIYLGFERQAKDLFEEEKEDSICHRMYPLLCNVFDMQKQYQEYKTQALKNPDPDYIKWLQEIESN